ncbi:DEAD/DEAH box helicase [Streptacidiphilus sp. EB103A]|uniref:DEAD/DEAH box helicase n=1 Tax=Streptacidiphilus sp. EB103A TaxID=3156275 RepID=UPI003518DE48
MPAGVSLGSGDLSVVRWSDRSGCPKVGRVPYFDLSLEQAWPVLVRCRTQQRGDPACRFWGAAVLLALELVAEGRLDQTLTASGYDAWRLARLTEAQREAVEQLRSAMPPHAHAASVNSAPARPAMTDPAFVLSAFLDAMADFLPRTPGAALATGSPAFAAPSPQHVPHLVLRSPGLAGQSVLGVRISLRLELGADTETGVVAVVQVHDTGALEGQQHLLDAGMLWREPALPQSPDAVRQMESLVALRRAARAWSALGRLLSDRDQRGTLELDAQEVQDLLGGAVVSLARADCAVHWPRDLVRTLTGRTVVAPKPATAAPASLLSTDQLLNFSWRAALGGVDLTDDQMDLLAESKRPVVRLRDRWVVVDDALLRRARRWRLGEVGGADALVAALTGTAEIDGQLVEVHPAGWLAEVRTALTAGPEQQAEVPAALNGELRHYQARGLAWLHRVTTNGLGGGILADDMGLGKTITLIALHLLRQRSPGTAGPTLVVCPATLLGTWEREIGRFAPHVAVRRFHGPARSLDTLPSDAFVLTTYGTLRRSTAALSETVWSAVVADEAQMVKNPFSATATALRKIPAQARVALTGTPVENALSDLWAVMDWAVPNLLGTLPRFRERFAKPIEADQDPKAAARLAALISPFVLRRRKSDPGIAPELPLKTETDQYVPLSKEQGALYEAVTREALAEIRASDGIGRRGLVLRLLTSLRQVCNHPAQFLKESDPANLSGRSGKLDLLDVLVDQILAEGQAALVFSQYVEMTSLIAGHLERRRVRHEVLTGSTGTAQRQRLVDRFQDGDFPVFLLSLRAAGTGLTLTRAEHVVQYDQWWNPAVMDQASDRAYRIGQTRPVQVHRLVSEGTVEERLMALLAAKRTMADSVVNSTDLRLTELGDDQLADLVALRRPR